MLLCCFTGPPGGLQIEGVDQVLAEESDELNCIAESAGTPPAQLAWFMGNDLLDSQTHIIGDQVRASVSDRQ